MNTPIRHRPLLAGRCAAALAATALAWPMLATAQGETNARQLYEQARTQCGTESRADCLYEARSVLRDARQGKLRGDNDKTLADNALARCDAVPQDVRDSCQRMARGEGQREGSVGEGAVVKWLGTGPQ